MTSNKSILGLAVVALLGLASCSSEPSDWRADKKVSVDMVPPGARESYDFDLATDAPSQHKGGAIEKPVSSQMEVEQTLDPARGLPDKPTADQAMTPDATQAEGSKEGPAATKGPSATQHDLNNKEGVQKQN
ncbi:hypothetical protein [Hymenobacter latericus]|uniref:hypothetical protein n=1 Tax=Hymenobacter sp. YIM 151858-1 TaxID=2987688 RepID=UPI0022261495|nr:hypothetical protein [Hymenobacter sp. YIM 151858-1]UYZ58285.1 hypothetical protein OIS50_14610 [Hymenobacter sp. YIM 151858-1]